MEHRLRIPNFSKSEVALLEELVLSGSSTLVKGVSNAAGWEAKKNAWKKLAIQFNAQNSYFRSAATLRKKWDNRKIKQKLAQRVNNTHTGGTPSERNCDRAKGECITELLNTPETEPESMFDCDADSRMEQRLRIPNFSESEVALLEDLVSRGSSILVKGVSNAAGWEAKQIAWRKLAIQFNAQNSYFRSSATLRKKWDNRKMKKKLAQRENNTHLRGTTSESNCDGPKGECTTELLNTPETGPESMFDCDGDSKDDTYMIEAPFTAELDPLGSEKEDPKAKFVANPTPMGRIRRLRWRSSKSKTLPTAFTSRRKQPQPRQNSKRAFSCNTAEKVLELIDNKIQSVETIQSEDDFDILGKYIANRMRKLPDQMKIITEKLINDLLFHAQVGNLTFDSVITTSNINSNINRTSSSSSIAESIETNIELNNDKKKLFG